MRKAAIIGCGMIANFAHIPAYRHLPGEFTIAGVCDVNEKSAADTAARHNIPYHTSDAKKLLEDTQPDIVSVCVPNKFHAQYIRLALEAGAHVLCEKPLALTKADAVELFALAESKGLMLCACQSMRFTPDRLEAKGLIEAGALGELYYGEFARIRRRGIPKWGAFHIESISGGGAFVDIGVHMLDAVVWLTGNTKPVAVSGCKSARLAHSDKLATGLRDSGALTGQTLSQRVYSDDEFNVEDFASGSVAFENGMRINFKTAWAVNLPDETSIVLAGDLGGIRLPEFQVYSGFAGRQADIQPKITAANPYPKEEFGGHFQLLDHVAAYLDGREELFVKPEETIAVSAIIDMFYRSAKEGREVTIDEL
ncbi:MAG: Gfo/Idh/MocA family oxidoreductase [Clostridia bacterium]|nr:Gfo/Idh/MocA family oxidoreductase [Clostridia bacterium]